MAPTFNSTPVKSDSVTHRSTPSKKEKPDMSPSQSKTSELKPVSTYAVSLPPSPLSPQPMSATSSPQALVLTPPKSNNGTVHF